MKPHTPTLEWSLHHEEALTVACPEAYCERLIGEACVNRLGQQLTAQPAHLGRRQAAALAAGHELDLTAPEVEPAEDDRPTVTVRRASRTRAGKTRCNWCEAEIVWATTRNDELMPVDAAPAADGNVLLTVEQGKTRASVFGKRHQAAAVRASGQQLHKHHRVTCPHSSRWPRKK